MKLTSRRTILSITAVMMGILLLLAYLQYTWLGQLSEEEFERMQNTVRSAAFDASMRFSRQITSVLRALSGPLRGTDDQVRSELLARAARWDEAGMKPRILTDSVAILPAPPPHRTVSVRVEGHAVLLLYRDLSAIDVPLEGDAGRVARVRLDRDQLTRSVIPEILEQVSLLDGTYEIAVVGPQGQALFLSDSAALRSSTQRADVTMPLMTLPPGPIAMADVGAPPQGQALPFPREREGPGPRPEPPRGEMPQRSLGPPGGEFHDGGGGERGLFELRVRHREGSLEEAVRSNRIRNLAISLGVLLMLGATVGFLIWAAARAQQLARQQLEFVATVSHELRTPLAVLNSAGENLADGVINDAQRMQQYGQIIKEEVLRLSGMVERTLAFAGIQSGRQTYETQPVQMAEIIERALHEVRRHFPSDNLTVETKVQPGLPLFQGEPFALQSALENLLTNALKYSVAEKWLGISAQTVSENSQTSLEITITDRGIGIPPGDLKHVFEPFYRGRSALDGQVRGSGLGLTIARHVIEAHGGTIRAKSAEHRGSTFTIRIPVKPEEGPTA